MSSAILYLAIVAIWACVLIPRWLKRDSARAAAAPAPAPAPFFAETGDESDEGDAGLPEDIGEPIADRKTRSTAPVSPEESRRRMLAARRRLMVMLIGLEIAAITLAVLGLAAIWVVVPPTLMLVGYLLLLREASRADAEYTRRVAELAAAAHARQRARARTAHGRRDTPVEGTFTAGSGETAAALAAKFAAAPVPDDYEGAGRDFAPGLAGKYTTSNANADPVDREDYDDEDYDQAVGD
jgi:hypothetical protein